MRYHYDNMTNRFTTPELYPFEIDVSEGDSIEFQLNSSRVLFEVIKIPDYKDDIIRSCELCDLCNHNKFRGMRLKLCEEPGLCPCNSGDTYLKLVHSMPKFVSFKLDDTSVKNVLIELKFIYCDSLCPYRENESEEVDCDNYLYDSSDLCLLGKLMCNLGYDKDK